MGGAGKRSSKPKAGEEHDLSTFNKVEKRLFEALSIGWLPNLSSVEKTTWDCKDLVVQQQTVKAIIQFSKLLPIASAKPALTQRLQHCTDVSLEALSSLLLSTTPDITAAAAQVCAELARHSDCFRKFPWRQLARLIDDEDDVSGGDSRRQLRDVRAVRWSAMALGYLLHRVGRLEDLRELLGPSVNKRFVQTVLRQIPGLANEVSGESGRPGGEIGNRAEALTAILQMLALLLRKFSPLVDEAAVALAASDDGRGRCLTSTVDVLCRLSARGGGNLQAGAIVVLATIAASPRFQPTLPVDAQRDVWEALSAAISQDHRDGAFCGLVAMAAFARRREHLESATTATMDKVVHGLVALLPLSAAKKKDRREQGMGCRSTMGHGHTAVQWSAATWHNFWSVRMDEETLWSAAVAAARVALRWRTPWHAAVLRAGAADALLALVANDSSNNASAVLVGLVMPRWRRRHLEGYCAATAEAGCPHVLLPEEALPPDLVLQGEGEEEEGEEESGEKPVGEKLRRAAWDALALLAASYGALPCGGDLEAGAAAGKGQLSKETVRGVHLMHIITCKKATTIFRPRGPALDCESYTLKEEVSILSALVALVSCAHSGLSACSRRNLASALGREKQQWECILSQAVWSDRHLSQFDPRLKARLLLATAAATLPHCRRWMLDHGVVWWLLEEIKKRMNGDRWSSTESPHNPSSSSSSTSNGVVLESLSGGGEEEGNDDGEDLREIDPDLWPGKDEVLFFAVRAMAELLVGDSRAHGCPEGLGPLSSGPKKGGGGKTTPGDSEEVPEAAMRRSLATTLEDLATRENDWAPGVRTWATYALSGLGVFGVPSLLGSDLAAARQVSSPESADVTLLTSAPGEAPARILAHRSVLLARCPALMCSVAQQGGPDPSSLGSVVERRMSSRISARSCAAMIEYVYMGVVRVANAEGDSEDATGGNMVTLARRCGLHELAALLQGRRPAWGEIRHECNLRHMLDDAAKYCSDFILKLPDAGQLPTAGAGRAVCAELGAHIHAHSFVLGARSEYYRGLLNFSRPSERGMHEANLPNLQARAAGALVSYLYSGSLTFRSPADPCFRSALLAAEDRSCDATSAPRSRSRNAAAAIELIGACEYYLLSHLRGLCEDYVAHHLAAPSTPVDDVVMLAKEAERWALADIVAKAVDRLGAAYLDLRDRGLLDTLPAWISEAVRRSHVKRTQDT